MTVKKVEFGKVISSVKKVVDERLKKFNLPQSKDIEAGFNKVRNEVESRVKTVVDKYVRKEVANVKKKLEKETAKIKKSVEELRSKTRTASKANTSKPKTAQKKKVVKKGSSNKSAKRVVVRKAPVSAPAQEETKSEA